MLSHVVAVEHLLKCRQKTVFGKIFCTIYKSRPGKHALTSQYDNKGLMFKSNDISICGLSKRSTGQVFPVVPISRDSVYSWICSFPGYSSHSVQDYISSKP
jgi:hypothetical protein